MTRTWIGTSGYSYADWIGPFYPAGTRPNEMLSYYSQAFPLVELNFTFYRMPSPGELARLAEQSPEGFQFIVKLPRSLSHERVARGLPTFRLAVKELQRRGRLLGTLAQLPQSAHFGTETQQWVESLGQGLEGMNLSVEFRHRSWNREEVSAWLREHDLLPVSVDVPDLPGLYRRGLVDGGARIYIRLHSRNMSWYESSRGRYDYLYSEGQLAEWIHRLEELKEPAEDVYFLFNNCYGGQAIQNAQQLQAMLRRSPRDFTVMEPHALAGQNEAR